MRNWTKRDTTAGVVGALLTAVFVMAWPDLNLGNDYYTLNLKNDTPGERRICDLYGAVMGSKLFMEADHAGNQTKCVLLVYGHFDASGNFIASREVRNPLDVTRYPYFNHYKHMITADKLLPGAPGKAI